MASPEILVDDEQYRQVARVFLVKLVAGIVRTLRDSRAVEIDLDNVTEGTVDLIFQMSFLTLASFEDHGGFAANGQIYVAHVGFATRPSAPDQILISWARTALHGGVEDDVILEAIETVRNERL
jgi:hypothetical protein